MSHRATKVPTVAAERAVLETLLRRGPLSRSDLARRLGMTNARLTQVSTELLRRGALAEQETEATNSLGRPGHPLRIIPEHAHFIGARLHETVVTTCLTDLETTVVHSRETPLPDHDVETVCRTLAADITALAEQAPNVEGCGLTLAGQTTDDGVVRRAPYLGWTDVALGERLGQLTHLPVCVDNDVVGLIQAEHWFGVGCDYDQFGALILGTGIGAGSVVNDQRIAGPDDGLGLIAHAHVSESGQLCPQGHRGCARAMLSLGGIANAVSQGIGRTVTFDQALRERDNGDKVARRVFDDAVVALGRLLSLLANFTMPEAVVVSGEAAAFAFGHEDEISAVMTANRNVLAHSPELVFRRIDPVRWARGAAARAIHAFAFHG